MTPLRIAVLLLACFVPLCVSGFAQAPPFTIGMRDACDPGTFTAAAGPGVCKPGQHGTTKFKFSSRNSNPITSLALGDSIRC